MDFPVLRKGLLFATAALFGLAVLQATEHAFAHGKSHKKQSTDAHVHGVGELDVVSEGNGVSVSLFSPLNNVLGFERTPKTSAEKEKATKAVSLLKAGSIVAFNPEAKCTRVDAVLTSDVLNPHSHGPDDKPQQHSDSDHSDILMRWEFQCENPRQLQTLTVRVFSLFPLFNELQAQVVMPGRQMGTTLTPRQSVLTLR